MQGCVVVPYLTRHDVSSAQAVGVHSINNCVVLGKHSGECAVVTIAIGVLSVALRSST